jgi:hypothetical protein|nr:MAG TPA: hypothetical protein [Caudoviricetes sp.]
MFEMTISQILGATLIASSFYLIGYITCYLDVKKKQRKQDNLQEMLDIEQDYQNEIKTSVWDELAERRKYSISDNDF